jgi:hypothetical protein
MSFKENLQNIREEHVHRKNLQFHETVKAIVDEAIIKINIDSMKETLINKIKQSPESKSVEVKFEFSLDKLYIKNEVEPLEIWYNNIRYIISKYPNINYNEDEFCDYLYETEPNIQRIKYIFKEAFPEAIISPFIFIHGKNCLFRVSVIYYLENIKASELKKPVHRLVKGDFPKW